MSTSDDAGQRKISLNDNSWAFFGELCIKSQECTLDMRSKCVRGVRDSTENEQAKLSKQG